jgi:hypothetical protein
LSRGVGTREPRKYSEITHPGSGNLTEKGHAYSVMMSLLTKRCCICDRAMETAHKHPFTGEPGLGEGCKCGPLLELIGASQLALNRAKPDLQLGQEEEPIAGTHDKT